MTTEIMQELFAPHGTPADAQTKAIELKKWLDHSRPGWRGRASDPLPRVVRDLFGMWSRVLDLKTAADEELQAVRRGLVDVRDLVRYGIEEAHMRDACLGLLDDLRGLDAKFITFDMMQRSIHWDRLRDHLTAQRGKGPQAVTAIVRAVWRHASERSRLSPADPEPGVLDRGSLWEQAGARGVDRA